MVPTVKFDGFSELTFKRPISKRLNFTFQEISSIHGQAHDEIRLHLGDMEIKLNPFEANPSSQPSAHVHELEPVAKAHRFMWLFLVVTSLIWGTLAGIAFTTGFGPYPSVAITGLLGIVVLALTLFRLGRARTLDER